MPHAHCTSYMYNLLLSFLWSGYELEVHFGVVRVSEGSSPSKHRRVNVEAVWQADAPISPYDTLS